MKTKNKHNTKIEWTHIPNFKGETWNPIIGCSKVSPACTNCYAEKVATRLSNIETTTYYKNVIENGKWNGKTHLVSGLLDKPLQWKKPRAIFVGSMTDVFHESVPDEWIDDIMARTQFERQHIFIFLTKRPERMKQYFSSREFKGKYCIDGVIQNVWLGVTAENQEQAIKRIPILLDTPAVKRFVSIEPMLSSMDLRALLDPL